MLTNVRHLDLKNLENVKTVFEHVSLYVGLVIFTAAGAKVGSSSAPQAQIVSQKFEIFCETI